MRILAVTGRLAEEDVRRSLAGIGADVLVLDLDVAAFITPKMLMEAHPKGFDLILIPGAVSADFSRAEEVLGSKIRLGPKHAVDLGAVVEHVDEVELSKTIPACVLMAERIASEAKALIGRLESSAGSVLSLRGVKIGGSSRMKVLAEIVDATRLDSLGLISRIEYYESQGADMIDLGIPLDAGAGEVARAVKIARGATSLPVSVDTISSELILAGVEAGAEMVLSLEGRNLPVAGPALARAGIPAVVIPGPGTLEENLASALSMGIDTIADPVLDPPLQGMASSLLSFYRFRKAYSDMPLFFGVGNVTELLDADSTGANALLAAIGAELGASILFTPEYSDKARGSVRELRIASEMMALAQARKSPPKDLGLDLLMLKEKRRRPNDRDPGPHEEATSAHSWEKDPAGSFVIGIANGQIRVRGRGLALAGKSARDLLNTLIDRGSVTRLDHAGYLGRELARAEIALQQGRSYCQDDRF